MSSLSFNQLTLSLAAAAFMATALTALASEPPTVVDPTTGETVSITDIDIASLSEEDRQNIGDQLADQGIATRGGRAPQGEPPSVVDPTTGETVSITDIDISSLSQEDRQNIGDQLADQGIATRGGHGRGAAPGGRGRDGGPRGGGAEVAEAGSAGPGAGGRGGEGPGGRGGPGGEGPGGRGGPGGEGPGGAGPGEGAPGGDE